MKIIAFRKKLIRILEKSEICMNVCFYEPDTNLKKKNTSTKISKNRLKVHRVQIETLITDYNWISIQTASK